ncbi:MAG TPA: metalloregulator ArsR/SmtB family transcription factor [Phycisphaerae bacterium]|nr:metalloregulator ArsR/SmtB family transcription factor [Phycisphaerae bacterium]
MSTDLVFKALADPTRQRILQVIVNQEVNVSELVEILRQPQSTVSRHLRVLRDAELILDRREGTTAVYAAVSPTPDGDGNSDRLRGRLLDWVAEQPLPRAVARRLERVLHNRRMRSEAFFERVGHRWDQLREDCYGPAFPFEALTALLPRDWTVADVGTGTGYLLPHLAAQFARVIAVDPVPAMLKAARDRPDLRNTDNVDFRAGDLSGLPMEDGEVDLALAILVLHHVPSPPAALAELGRIVKPEGHLVLVEQVTHQCEEFHERMQDRWWGFEPEALATQVRQNGFADVRHVPLASAEPTTANTPETPQLFVLTARRTSKSPGEKNEKKQRETITERNERDATDFGEPS